MTQSSRPPDQRLTPEQEFQDLRRRCRERRFGVEREVQAWLQRHPHLAKQVGELQAYHEQKWIIRISACQHIPPSALNRKVADLRAEMTSEAAQRLEGLLVDQVVLTWLHLQFAESAVLDDDGDEARITGRLQKRLDTAQRQHASAIERLQKYQRLLTPVARGSKSEKPPTEDKSPASPAGHVVARSSDQKVETSAGEQGQADRARVVKLRIPSEDSSRLAEQRQPVAEATEVSDLQAPSGPPEAV